MRELGGSFDADTLHTKRPGDRLYWHNDGEYLRYVNLNIGIEKYCKFICSRDEFNHVVADYRRLYEWDFEILEESRRVLFASWLKNSGAKASNLAGESKFQWRTEYNPESSSKPEVDNWHERGDKPPVGTECEYSLGESGAWYKCRIEYTVGSQGVVMYCDAVEGVQYCSFTGRQMVKFRPIQSERDKAIEAAMKMHKAHHWGPREFAEALCDAGWRPTSNSPE